MKKSHSNPEVSAAEAFLLFIKPLACFVGCSSRAVTRSHCGHRGERLNEAKGLQTSRDLSEVDGAPDSHVGYWQQKLLMCTSFAAFLSHHSLEQSFVLALQSVASVSKPAARQTHYEPFFVTRLHSYLLCY